MAKQEKPFCEKYGSDFSEENTINEIRNGKQISTVSKKLFIFQVTPWPTPELPSSDFPPLFYIFFEFSFIIGNKMS